MDLFFFLHPDAKMGAASKHSAPYAAATNDFLISWVQQEILESVRAADSQAQRSRRPFHVWEGIGQTFQLAKL